MCALCFVVVWLREGDVIYLRVAAVAAACFMLASPSSAANSPQIDNFQNPASPYLRVHGVTQPPHGFVDFCARTSTECADGVIDELRRPGTGGHLAELDRINRQINAEIEPATDLEVYGVKEYWAVPTKRGDCEDYALLKRKRLMQLGWPAGALLMTVVLDEKGEGHAVLTARTADGDFVLDNKIDDLKLWHKTGYRFIMRQSYLNPRVWMSLDPRQAAPSSPVAGFKPTR